MSYSRPPPDVEGMTSLKMDNLTYCTSPDTLRRLFEKYGCVGDVYIPRDRYTKESRGFAFVRFHDKRDAEDAMDAMDGAVLDGRELWVQMACYGRPPDSRHSRQGLPPCRYGGGGYRRWSHSPRRRRRSPSRSRSRSRSHSRSRYLATAAGSLGPALAPALGRPPSLDPHEGPSPSPRRSPDLARGPGPDLGPGVLPRVQEGIQIQVAIEESP
ncbi:hypothetical protein P7K49_038672 [Saguinus oedipus]|uniref:RRM domain-containing protein n=1 Tax=Saguinus oedipus TaxID=9490 RepID=A0ABQ9TFD5_SAGOE|nr:hypothetical protein P7K49_038672 [Saguinus oedipus]